MNLGLVAEITTDKSLDSFTEFKEGVKLLKNDYPQGRAFLAWWCGDSRRKKSGDVSEPRQ